MKIIRYAMYAAVRVASGALMPASTATSAGTSGPERTTLDELQCEAIRQALAQTGGNISQASRRLGISRNTIYRKLRWKTGTKTAG